MVKIYNSDAAVLMGISEHFYLFQKCVNAKANKNLWMSDYLETINYSIINDEELNENMVFKHFTRMIRENFDSLLSLVRSMIEKNDTYFIYTAPPEIRLAICVRYLATVDSFIYLMYLFKVSLI